MSYYRADDEALHVVTSGIGYEPLQERLINHRLDHSSSRWWSTTLRNARMYCSAKCTSSSLCQTDNLIVLRWKASAFGKSPGFYDKRPAYVGCGGAGPWNNGNVFNGQVNAGRSTA